MSKRLPAIVWFRRDLRLSDNPALHKAVELDCPIIPLYIYSPEDEGQWAPGGASKWWLHHSLVSLQKSIEEKGSKLIIRTGNANEVLAQVIEQTRASHIFWNRLYEPAIIERDIKIKEQLLSSGVEAHSFNGALLKEPSTFKNKAKKPFQVFTPFWKALQQILEVSNLLPEPAKIESTAEVINSLEISALRLLSKIDWAAGFNESWQPGEKCAQQAAKKFLKAEVEIYNIGRDIPSVRGTSRMSPHLHFGEISPGQIWHIAKAKPTSSGVETYLKEIGWREFAHHLLFHFPHTPVEPLRQNFKNFPWANDSAGLVAWQKGQTGYPIVDAGMRELYHTGWMHNRVRMIVSSFLVKDLLISWLDGAKWFWDTLVDASLASNTLGWQWSGGCGADAAPFFRIFNPITQGQKYDATGEYVRRWVPELKDMPDKYLHKPWAAPAKILEAAGVTLGETYPKPIIDHDEARGRALRAFDRVKAQ